MLRQRQRRLVRAEFAAAVVRSLAVGGAIEVCTDDADYAAQMAAVLGREPGLRGGIAARASRPCTYYEQLARDAGRTVVDLRFARVETSGAS
jgi:tRNA G46 methylase TrmB